MVDSCWIVDAPVPGASPRRGFIAKLHREAGCRRAERLRADFAASRGAVPHLRQSRGSRPDDGPRSAADLAALLNARLGTDVGLTDLRWVSYFLAQRGVVSALGAGRRFLLGDAGHLSSPMGGEGINSALPGVATLSPRRERAFPAGATSTERPITSSFAAARRPSTISERDGAPSGRSSNGQARAPWRNRRGLGREG
jgi:2-polyprenyl-6-methoxyphenol hydroxylase-like FAD-dependent oxidoreductase